MVTQQMPSIEVINREQIVDAGHRYKEEILKLKTEILAHGKVGSYTSTKNIEEAENDPNFELKDDEEQYVD